MNTDSKHTPTPDKETAQTTAPNTATDTATDTTATQEKKSFFGNLIDKCMNAYDYLMNGVWKDPRNSMKVRIVKTLNLTMSAFFNSSLQIRSMALTYSTVLSVVPLLALLVAIGRGFGLQELIQTELFKLFPSQAQSIGTALQFVDSYLNTAAQGVFVGVGIVVLLYTVISLLSYIEDTFNTIWGVQTQRTIYQKLTDYIAICLIIPVLLICSSGISVFMSSFIQETFKLPILTPLLNWTLEILAPLVLAWLAFTLSYYLIPNTKVEFKYAAISGALAAVAFQVLQMLFLNGQIYVSNYNAIYGSFAFLPLMLVWLQLSWLALLTGCMLAYSMQNVFTFNLMGSESKISTRGWHFVALIIMAVTSKRYSEHQKPYSEQELAVAYYLPIRIVGLIITKLTEAGLIYKVMIDDNNKGIIPAMEPSELTVAKFLEMFDKQGVTDFIPDFKNIYAPMTGQLEPDFKKAYEQFGELLVKDIKLPTPEAIRDQMLSDARSK